MIGGAAATAAGQPGAGGLVPVGWCRWAGGGAAGGADSRYIIIARVIKRSIHRPIFALSNLHNYTAQCFVHFSNLHGAVLTNYTAQCML